ncbi:hypothetical protein SPV1_00085 [Mariprofundus ferrooxydans PV-1]|uniref:Uncharacterized protein n=1 Tax=Mariprofundus ferrooxydans PV-1 TaxID=314345 RepID=Q0EYN7_9PROT|nr:hypothetical protein SPV1_00085 [Mariprofundus ferrooxydans PV-1]
MRIIRPQISEEAKRLFVKLWPEPGKPH